MEPATGKILAWVSKPDFNPNNIGRDWDRIIADNANAPLLNRVSQGMYPPGSTFKTLTALQYLRQHGNNTEYSYQCTGRIEVGGTEIRCFNNSVHGHVDLSSAYAKSCNTAFANMGLEMNLSSFSSLSNDMLFATDMPVPYPARRSQFVLNRDSTPWQVAQTSIGQGETLMSPLHLNLITCAIANDGRVMRPYVIDRTENYRGVTVRQNRPSSFTNILSPEEVTILQGLMEEVVSSGTATALSGRAYEAAGKTGSAEYIRGQSHAWFTGYAEGEEKETIALTIIVESGGTGGGAAVPIARNIFDTYFR
jgi:peptidoglycan glycosyltransferase